MKVLIVGPFPDPIHGMSLANLSLYQGLLKNNINVYFHDTVNCRKLKDKNKQGKLELSTLYYSFLNNFKLMCKIFKHRYDIVLITPGQSVLGFLRFLPIVLFCKLLGTKIIQHIHGSRLRKNIEKSHHIFKFLCNKNIKLTSKFIILSETILNDYSSLIDKEKMVVCYNGVPIPSALTHTSNDKKINVLFLSNLMIEKGILDLFQAIRNFSAYNVNFQFAGIIESSIKNECDIFFNQNTKNCKYFGQVSGDMKESLFRNADIFILPSYDEGVPLSILEAYSYSCAVITTPVGGVPDIFKENINGIYARPRDYQSLINALIAIYPDIEKYKKQNRIFCKKKFSIDSFVMSVEKVLLETYHV